MRVRCSAQRAEWQSFRLRSKLESRAPLAKPRRNSPNVRFPPIAAIRVGCFTCYAEFETWRLNG